MTLSLNAKSLVFAGSALAVLAGLAMPSEAKVMSAKEFMASLDETKTICRRLDEPFWQVQRRYGCGEVVHCKAGSCFYRKRPQLPPRAVAVLVLPDGSASDHSAHSHDKGPNGR